MSRLRNEGLPRYLAGRWAGLVRLEVSLEAAPGFCGLPVPMLWEATAIWWPNEETHLLDWEAGGATSPLTMKSLHGSLPRLRTCGPCAIVTGPLKCLSILLLPTGSLCY